MSPTPPPALPASPHISQLASPAFDPIQAICLGKSPYMGMVISQHFHPRLFFKHYLTPADPCADLLATILIAAAAPAAPRGVEIGDAGVALVLFGMGWTGAEVEDIRAQVREADQGGKRKRVPWIGPREMLSSSKPGAGAGGGAGPGAEAAAGTGEEPGSSGREGSGRTAGPAQQPPPPTLTSEQKSAFAKSVASRVLALVDQLKQDGKMDEEAFYYF